MSASRMSRNVQPASPYSPPEVASGSLQGDERTPDERTDAAVADRYIARGYDILRSAVKEWGGSASLAAWWSTSESNLSARLNRRVVNGSLSYAFLDFLMVASTAPRAAEQILFDLCDLWGFEHPKRKQRKTEVEKYHALVGNLRRLGPLGETAIAVAARDLGIDPAEFDR